MRRNELGLIALSITFHGVPTVGEMSIGRVFIVSVVGNGTHACNLIPQFVVTKNIYLFGYKCCIVRYIF